MKLTPPLPEVPADLCNDELSILERQIARRADQLAREMRERHDDSTLWARAQAEILHEHEGPTAALNFRSGVQFEDNVLRENICR